MWSIFHTLAERSGTIKQTILQDDERRFWIQLLRATKDTLPCDHCREHYSAWLVSRPPEVLKTLPYAEVHGWIREWFFALHNQVNTRNGKSVFLIKDLEDTYKNVNITEMWRRLEPVIRVAIQLSGITLAPWQKWLRMVRSLQGFYGV
jgi:hypothetical protein